jgi:hypothetical protein
MYQITDILLILMDFIIVLLAAGLKFWVYQNYTMCQNIQYWNEKKNSITLLSSVSLFLLKETNIYAINMLIYHGLHTGNMCAGAMPHWQMYMHIQDAWVSVLYILAHTVS